MKRKQYKKDKISVTYFSDAPYAGGAERYIHLLASNLDRDVFRPSLIMKYFRDQNPLVGWMEKDEIPVIELDIELTGGLKGGGSLIKYLRELGTDILHMNLPGPFDSQYSLVAPLAKLAGVKIIITTEHLPMVPSFFKGSVLKYFSTLFTNRVVTVSRDNVRYLVKRHKVPLSKIVTIYNGIPEPSGEISAGIRSSLGLEDSVFLGVMVGSLESRKGHPDAFKAMMGLEHNFHLLVVGKGEMGSRYIKMVENMGMKNRVHFLGYRDDVMGIISDSDVMIVPSIIEATPYVIIEAMALGVPVVANRIYGIPELVEEGKTGIKRIMDDGNYRRQMGERARLRYQKNYKLERFIRNATDLYIELMNRSSIPGDK
jgi:glycosyltransferase involved in cell wall biosynthesis